MDAKAATLRQKHQCFQCGRGCGKGQGHAADYITQRSSKRSETQLFTPREDKPAHRGGISQVSIQVGQQTDLTQDAQFFIEKATLAITLVRDLMSTPA